MSKHAVYNIYHQCMHGSALGVVLNDVLNTTLLDHLPPTSQYDPDAFDSVAVMNAEVSTSQYDPDAFDSVAVMNAEVSTSQYDPDALDSMAVMNAEVSTSQYDPNAFDSMAVMNAEVWSDGREEGAGLTGADILPHVRPGDSLSG